MTSYGIIGEEKRLRQRLQCGSADRQKNTSVTAHATTTIAN